MSLFTICRVLTFSNDESHEGTAYYVATWANTIALKVGCMCGGVDGGHAKPLILAVNE